MLLWSCSDKSKISPGDYSDYDYGRYFMYTLKKYDSAYQKFKSYVNNPGDTFKKAQAYRHMGDIQWYLGDLYGAQQSLTNAENILDTTSVEHRKELSIVNNILGNVSLDMKVYDEALSFYEKAVKFDGGTNYLSEILNGKAVTYQRMKKYDYAIATYDSILKFKMDDNEGLVRVLHNRAHTKWLKDSSYPALPEYWSVLKLRLDSHYNSGIVMSYAHLSDYYDKANPDSALWYAYRMLGKAKENQSASDVSDALYRIILLNKDINSQLPLIKEYKEITDSIQFARDTSSNRFALIENDSKKIDKVNVELRKHISLQRIMLYSLGVLTIIIIAGISFWFGKRQNRIKQESEAAIQDARLKTSQKVHDVVANGLYRIMNELEHGTSIEKEPLLTKIDDLYEKSRDISYEAEHYRSDEVYAKQMEQLLTGFGNDETQVHTSGNEPFFWSRLSGLQKRELELVLNELMVNMKKHSRAKQVFVSFSIEGNNAAIQYTDDGVGFGDGHQNGNGLTNTVNRIKTLNGEINFGKNGDAGVGISISLPLQFKKA